MTCDQEKAISASVHRVMDAWAEFNAAMVQFNLKVDRSDYTGAEEFRFKASAYFEAACDESIKCHRLMIEAGAR